MEHNWFYIVALISCSSIIAVNFFYTFKLLNKILYFYRAKSITDELNIGDYVKVQGVVKMPTIESPFFNLDCVYWKSYVWASFETKRKKPDTGMQEHTPLLEVKESVMPPLMVRQSDMLVHVDFSQKSSLMLNLEKRVKRKRAPPNETTAKLAKEKYKMYKVHEYSLPVDANVAVWGKVDSISSNVITIIGSNSDKQPCFLYNGPTASVYRLLKNRIYLSMSIVSISAFYFFIVEWAYSSSFLVLALFLFLIFYLQKLSIKKLF
ncbi:hypothetical protein [Pseudoalteromonas luteoviolacea]|nr:hypothetical protein [Pseudoalteromonas luteoviolacea]